MKYPLVLAGIALLAAPAGAQPIHRTSLTHEGLSVPVTYEAQAQTRKRQIGLGPRMAPTCRWTTEVTVRRTTLDSGDQPIAALTRVVEGKKVSSGSQGGLCAAVPDRSTAAFGGDEAKMRQFLAQAAAADTQQLRAELASISSPHRNVAR